MKVDRATLFDARDSTLRMYAIRYAGVFEFVNATNNGTTKAEQLY